MPDHELLKKTRFHLDDPLQFGFVLRESIQDMSGVHAQFLTRHVKVSRGLFPGLAETIRHATEWLLGAENIHAFISADESMNAVCMPGPDNTPLIWISSGLIKVLSENELKFVIGHELGHWYYRHYLYPEVEHCAGPSFIARQQLSRAGEISSDRFGLFTCGDIESALRAILKTASGLTEEYFSPRVSEYIGQAKSLNLNNISQGEVFATHPPLVIRARALLWFSMSQEYAELKGDSIGALGLDVVNRRVEKDLASVLGKGFKKKQREEIQDAVFWMTLYELTQDGQLSKKDQKLIRQEFGGKIIEKISMFVSGKSTEQVRLEIREKAEAARSLISAYPKQEVEKQLDSNSLAAAYALKFLSRFN